MKNTLEETLIVKNKAQLIKWLKSGYRTATCLVYRFGIATKNGIVLALKVGSVTAQPLAERIRDYFEKDKEIIKIVNQYEDLTAWCDVVAKASDVNDVFALEMHHIYQLCKSELHKNNVYPLNEHEDNCLQLVRFHAPYVLNKVYDKREIYEEHKLYDFDFESYSV